MQLLVNGAPHEARDALTIADLLVELALGDRRVAVAVNRDVVPRAQHPSRRLNEGDRIEIVQAVQGG